MLQLDNMIAVNKEEEDIKHIGHLFWYTIGEDLYQREDIEAALINSGLSLVFMPNPIKPADAIG